MKLMFTCFIFLTPVNSYVRVNRCDILEEFHSECLNARIADASYKMLRMQGYATSESWTIRSKSSDWVEDKQEDQVFNYVTKENK